MNNYNIDVIITTGPLVYNSDELKLVEYITVGVKRLLESPQDSISDVTTIDTELIDEIINKIRTGMLKLKELKVQASDTNNETDIISLSDGFFEYLKNNETKIQAIRVSISDYEKDNREQKLKTIRLKSMVVTADKESIDSVYNTIVKELYYIFNDAVIDIYSILLTPKLYKIVNGIPVEYREILVRVKK